MLLQNSDFQVRQCGHELFIVQADSIVPRVSVPPALCLVLCIFAERAQYAFKVMLIFEPNMFLYECNACRFSIARNRCGCHVASDLDTIFLNHLPANFSVSTVAICWEPDDSHKLASQNVQSPGRTIELSDRSGNSEFSSIGQATAVDPGTPGDDHCSCTDFEDSAPSPSLAAKLRPDRSLVAIGPAGRFAGGRVARLAGAAAHEGALLRAARLGYIAHLLDLDFRNARQPRDENCGLGRGLRFAADRLDHPERNLHVPTHLRGGTLQSDAGQPDRDHPGPPPAVAA